MFYCVGNPVNICEKIGDLINTGKVKTLIVCFEEII